MLEGILAPIRENLEAKGVNREDGLKIFREIFGKDWTATFTFHGQDFETANNSIKSRKISRGA